MIADGEPAANKTTQTVHAGLAKGFYRRYSPLSLDAVVGWLEVPEGYL